MSLRESFRNFKDAELSTTYREAQFSDREVQMTIKKGSISHALAHQNATDRITVTTARAVGRERTLKQSRTSHQRLHPDLRATEKQRSRVK